MIQHKCMSRGVLALCIILEYVFDSICIIQSSGVSRNHRQITISLPVPYKSFSGLSSYFPILMTPRVGSTIIARTLSPCSDR